MKIELNGQSLNLLNSINLLDFLKLQGYSNEYFAVALNCNFIPRHQYAETILQEGDSLEIVMPMQGG